VSKLITVPDVAEIQRIMREQLKGFLEVEGMPTVACSTVEAPSKGWCRAEYYDALTGSKFSFYDVPTVVAVALVREGSSRLVTAPMIVIPPIELPSVLPITVPEIPVVEAPSISIPEVEIPAVPSITIPAITLPEAPTIDVPSITLPTAAEITIPKPMIDFVRDTFPVFVTDFAPLKPIVDSLNAMVGLLQKMRGSAVTASPVYGGINLAIDYANRGLTAAYESVERVIKQISDFRDNAQAALDDYSGKIKSSVDAGLADLKDKTEVMLSGFRSNVETSVSGAMSDYSDKVQTAFNSYTGNIKASVDAGLADAKAKTEETLSKFRGNVESTVTAALVDYRDKEQAAFSAYRDNIQRSLNSGLSQFIPVFYEMMGLPPPEVTEVGRKELMEMGDVNGDGVINQKDLDLITAAYGSREGDPNWNPDADLNKDGVVDISDASIVGANFGKTVVPTAQLLSPVQLRNVARDGFEFYGLSTGMKLCYVAVGRKG